MSTVSITITSATNPTYGGRILTDGVDYVRETLNTLSPVVSADAGSEWSRAFAFFDLSTDPTSGGDITKVELLATVASVSGTHAVDISTGSEFDEGGSPSSADSDLYAYLASNYWNLASNVTPSAGAFTQDLGVGAITDLLTAISDGSFYNVSIALSNEAAAGSVVFDAAVGFGLRITYTTLITAQSMSMMSRTHRRVGRNPLRSGGRR